MPSAGALIPFKDGTIALTTVKNFIEDFANFGFTLAEIQRADVVHISVRTNNIRYRYTGEVATTSTGHGASSDTEFTLNGKSIIQNFSVVSETGTANLWISLLSYGL